MHQILIKQISTRKKFHYKWERNKMGIRCVGVGGVLFISVKQTCDVSDSN